MPAGSSTWTNLSYMGSYAGVTTPSLTVSVTTAAMNGDQFRCVVSNPQGSIISGAATLTVGSVPVITGQPQNRSVTAGDSATFPVTTSGIPRPNYQWQRKPAGLSTWSNLSDGGTYSGATSSILTVSGVTATMSGDQFRCMASNSFGTATTDPAVLTVNIGLPPFQVAQQAYAKASNTGSDQFGYSVAVSGDTVVVGARFEASNATGVNGNQSDNSLSSSGAAYVFVRKGTNWSQQAYLKASNTGGPTPGDRQGGDFFGAAVAISGDTLVVGAYQEDSNATGVNGNQNDNSATNSGAAYVFVRNGTNWTQQSYLKASNTGAND